MVYIFRVEIWVLDLPDVSSSVVVITGVDLTGSWMKVGVAIDADQSSPLSISSWMSPGVETCQKCTSQQSLPTWNKGYLSDWSAGESNACHVRGA